MAVTNGEAEFGGQSIERTLVGFSFLTLSVFQVAQGPVDAVFAAVFAALSLFLLKPAEDAARQISAALVDFAVISTFTVLVDNAAVLWRSPETFWGVFIFSPVGGSVAALTYLLGMVCLKVASRLLLRVGLALLPFLFCLLIALGSPPVSSRRKSPQTSLRRRGHAASRTCRSRVAQHNLSHSLLRCGAFPQRRTRSRRAMRSTPPPAPQ